MNCGKCGKPIQSYLVVYNELEPYTPEYWCLACVWREGSDQILEEDKPEYKSQLQKEAEEKEDDEDDEDLFDLEDLEGEFDDPALNVAAVEDSISKYGDVTKLKYTGAYHVAWKPFDIDIPTTTNGVGMSNKPESINVSGSSDGVEVKAYDHYGNETYSWNTFESPTKGVFHDPNPNNAKVKVTLDEIHDRISSNLVKEAFLDNERYTLKDWKFTIDDPRVYLNRDDRPNKLGSDDYDIINKWFESSERGNEDPT